MDDVETARRFAAGALLVIRPTEKLAVNAGTAAIFWAQFFWTAGSPPRNSCVYDLYSRACARPMLVKMPTLTASAGSCRRWSRGGR